MGRQLAIGDIHGYADALEALLDLVQPDYDDQLIFLGDYVDKGPDVPRVMDRLEHLHATRPCDVFLLGNHDLLMMEAANDPTIIPTWESLAGPLPLASYGEGHTEEVLDWNVPDSHITFLEETCVRQFSTDSHIFVHGGIRPSVAPDQEEEEYLLWQKVTMAEPHQSGRTVICGHTSQASGLIVDLEHTICIDTGISKGQWLTCMDVNTLEFWQTDSEGKPGPSGALRDA